MTSQQLREARSTLGLTQKQMAEALGMTWRNYQRLEAGTVVVKKVYVTLINMMLEANK